MKTENIMQYFDKINTIIDENKHKKILVHCQNSVSRSVTIIIAYLMHTGKSLKDAINYVKSKRSQYTKPNIGFFKQLIAYEKQINGNNTAFISEYAQLFMHQ